MPNWLIAVDLHPRLHDRPLPGLHQTHSLHQLRLRAEGDLRQLGQHRAEIAGADRRGRSRQSDLAPNATATRPRSPSPSTTPAGRSTKTPSPRSGRGSSSRATSSSNSTRAARARRNWQRRHDPGQPHLDRGAARRSADRAAVAGPRRPRPPAGELRRRADPQADRRRRPQPAARSAGQDRRPGAERASSNTAAKRADTAPR